VNRDLIDRGSRSPPTPRAKGRCATEEPRCLSAGFDGVVTTRLIQSEKQITQVPVAFATLYPRFWSYYGYAWPMVYNPGYWRTDTIVQVETKVYALTDDKLIWAGLSETFNPRDAQALVRSVAQAVANDFKKQGLIV
jgi:hypothetical protein